MKNSGIEWIGEIPDDWEVVYLSSIFNEHKRKNIGLICKNLLSLSYGKIKRRDINTTDGLLPESFEGYNIIEKGDIVLRLTDLQNDQKSLRTGLAHETGLITSAYITIRCLPKIALPDYMHYYLHSFDTSKGFYGMGDGVRQGLNYDGIKKILMLLPPINEQQKIADYLDKKCAAVDRLIENQRAQIEKLKEYKQSVITEAVTRGLDPSSPLKDSDVEWLGKIPIGWNIMATKHLFRIISGSTPKSDNTDFWDGDIIWITPSDFNTEDVFVYHGKRNISLQGLKSCSTTLVPKNSIIFSKRAPIGLVVINGNDLCTNQGCLSCVNITNQNIKFFYYTMSICTEQYEILGSGTTFKEISAKDFANFKLPCPTKDEQQQIADFLDKKCADVDNLITINQQKIETLTEYKKSLIYEYVTGKKEVVS